jgi:hypothetical protein
MNDAIETVKPETAEKLDWTLAKFGPDGETIADIVLEPVEAEAEAEAEPETVEIVEPVEIIAPVETVTLEEVTETPASEFVAAAEPAPKGYWAGLAADTAQDTARMSPIEKDIRVVICTGAVFALMWVLIS